MNLYNDYLSSLEKALNNKGIRIEDFQSECEHALLLEAADTYAEILALHAKTGRSIVKVEEALEDLEETFEDLEETFEDLEETFEDLEETFEDVEDLEDLEDVPETQLNYGMILDLTKKDILDLHKPIHVASHDEILASIAHTAKPNGFQAKDSSDKKSIGAFDFSGVPEPAAMTDSEEGLEPEKHSEPKKLIWDEDLPLESMVVTVLERLVKGVIER